MSIVILKKEKDSFVSLIFYMKKLIQVFLLCSCGVSATLYENGEDKSTKRWEIYNQISDASIKNIYDRDRQSRVILFKSDDIRNGYMLPMERDSKSWCKTSRKSLKWSMSSKDDFVILISLQTIDGHRYIIYTPSDDKMGRGYYGLGKNSMNGEWHNFKRDLDLDLKRYEPNNEIIAVDTFFIRTKELKIDNIEIIGKERNSSSEKKPKSCNIYLPNLNQKDSKRVNKYDDLPPVIKLNGASTIYINLGQEYKEMGAVAIDNVDGRLNVDISGDINTDRVGTYTLFYMAKDKNGNTSMTTRIINVKGVSPYVAKTREVKKNKKMVKTKSKKSAKIDKIKSVEESEFTMPPEDNTLQEFGIIEE